MLSISDFCPQGAEAGVGLALQGDKGRYLFFIVDKKVFILLLPWALMALPKCFGALDCYEDCILFVSGVHGLVELIRNWKTRPADSREEPWVQRKVTGQGEFFWTRLGNCGGADERDPS